MGYPQGDIQEGAVNKGGMNAASVRHGPIRLALLAASLAAAPALAQDGDDPAADGTPDRESVVVVYGEDSCPQSTENEVVVCARRPETERYRIPPRLRRSGNPEQSWTSRVESLEEASRDARPNSCSVVGTYGQSGCTAALIRQWLAERRARPSRGY